MNKLKGEEQRHGGIDDASFNIIMIITYILILKTRWQTLNACMKHEFGTMAIKSMMKHKFNDYSNTKPGMENCVCRGGWEAE